MIIFLYGPDDYRRSQKKKDIIGEFSKKRSQFGLGFFDLEEKAALDDLGGFLRNQPMFEPARLAVLENAFEIPADKLAAALKPVINEKGVQVLIAEKDKPLKVLSFLVEKPVLFQKFEAFTEMELAHFIKEEGKARGIALADSAAMFLATVYAGQTWAAITELDKIASLKGAGAVDANGKNVALLPIEKRDLDNLDLEIAPNYWALMTGIKSFDIRNSLSALEKLFSINDPAPKIFNIIAGQAGDKMPRMAEYDRMVKSGKLEYEEALLDFVLG
jgi:DNA polymerase III delta subunit